MTVLTYNDMLSAYGVYPAPIRPYLLRAETHPVLRPNFTKSGLRVFVDLLARAPIRDPERPIHVRVDVVARDFGVSTKTVGRVLRQLLTFGWLSPFQGTDGRNNEGKFKGRDFLITTELRTMVGLPTERPPLPAIAAKVIPVSPGTEQHDDLGLATENPPAKVIPASPDVEQHDHLELRTETHPAEVIPAPSDVKHHDNLPSAPLDQEEDDIAKENMPLEPKMSDGLIGVNKVFKKEASSKEAFNKNTTSNEIRLPIGLHALHTVLKISKGGICKLMRLAKASNQRLQDVWDAAGHRILNAGALEGRAVAYFKFLLNTGEDFSYTARRRAGMPRHTSKNNHQDYAPAPRLDTRNYWNRKFRGANGVVVRVHGDGSGELTDATRREVYISPRDMEQIFTAIADGTLNEVVE
ncbi:MAG: hypothetical protein WKG03_00880 [Telluria sp.]